MRIRSNYNILIDRSMKHVGRHTAGNGCQASRLATWEHLATSHDRVGQSNTRTVPLYVECLVYTASKDAVTRDCVAVGDGLIKLIKD